LSVSSPSAAAPSKPANDRKPNTAALAMADSDVPLGSLNASAVIVCPFGEEPASSLTRITTPNARNAIRTAAISAITR
jgi:hypothetical protein